MRYYSLILLGFLSSIATNAQASGPREWALGFQESASLAADHIHEFHDMLLWIIAATALFVLILLIWVIIRYNHKANPTPKQFTHNVLLEVIWTAVPIIILIIIAIPSFKVLYYNDRTENPEMTLKVIGYQWYWNYEYPDHGNITFDSYMVADDALEPGQQRLLSTDTAVVLPVNTNVQILVSAGDVLHSWAVPSFGIKLDGVPGRWNETWVNIKKPGTYYGQCSELCGKDHAYMPIEIKAVGKAEFEAWASANAQSANYIPYGEFEQKFAANGQN